MTLCYMANVNWMLACYQVWSFWLAAGSDSTFTLCLKEPISCSTTCLSALLRCDREHSVCGRGPARRWWPEDLHCDVTTAGVVWPRRPAPFTGHHRSTPPAGGGHAASQRRTKRTGTPAHARQLHLLLVTHRCVCLNTETWFWTSEPENQVLKHTHTAGRSFIHTSLKKHLWSITSVYII